MDNRTAELNFKNLTVKYDGDKFSKSKIRILKAIETLGILALAGFLLSAIVLIPMFLGAENKLILSVFIGVTTVLTTFGGAIGLAFFLKKLAPRHYEFITWLMRFKKNEIEVGWLNNRYVVQMFSQDWHMKEFGNFIPENYRLNDQSDKSKPMHMTIDLTKDAIEVVVKND